MPVGFQDQRPRGRRSALYTVALVVLVVVVLVLIGRSGTNGPPSDDYAAQTAQSEDPLAPFVVQESTSFTIPDSVRTQSRSFDMSAGGTYLMEFEATARKPESSPGDAMYFGASLSCVDSSGVASRSIGGTQNVRTGESVTIRNQFLLEAESAREYSCRLSVSSPNKDAAAKGTSVDIQMEWTARPVEGLAVEASAEEMLPLVAEPGEREAVFRVDLKQGEEPVDILSTVHATTCTMVNGSTEGDRVWCRGEHIDVQGSAVELTYRADVLDDLGSVCASRILATKRESIGWDTHHRILALEKREFEPLSACGTTVRYVVEIENDGPAAVVLHQANSTFLAVSGEG